jgi:class 3 adenylate cyclase
MGIITKSDVSEMENFPEREIYFENADPDMITFADTTKKVCVGVVDVVGSTRITARLTNQSVARYYSTFLNTLGAVIVKFQGKIVKNIGDSILYYFPEGTMQSQFVRCLECNLSMLQIHDYLNIKLKSQGLPRLDYRISSDYGAVAIAKTPMMTEDIFGQPVNVCSKINTLAQPNSLVIGSDFYEVVKGMECYRFEGIAGFSSGLKNSYPVYTASYDDSKIRSIVSRCIEKTLLQMGTPDFELVVKRLFEKHNCFLSDCYEKPECLKDVLGGLYGNAGKAITKSIEKQVEEQSLPKPVKEFLIYLKD